MNIPLKYLALGVAIVAGLILSRGNWSNPILDQVAGFLRSTFGTLLNWKTSSKEPQHCIDCLLHVQSHLSNDPEAATMVAALVNKAMASHAKPTE